ncbi:hypothetical protein SPRG_17478 [Saprolegnia parasitica CBS 223.65]|uniref:AB hydrolase-1 domain-containing protein n=1 Tax=Saprolegnia parasitica (strain CBS 223.65) TaxID=695850 RepID=A0A067BS45_SAPPC|nr:hypothetical protein SPRG_17478 [Saprolegnia parasitica CBS 223.65]KDO17111.1 hypothetical protein SPRG_17478 [Saprolegnia parasitica CBS 223.65]|eukprot:XP_012212180.1 hypothetical protein SPRG_17478 [Saprolegnia parasitica CBS 223.65]
MLLLLYVQLLPTAVVFKASNWLLRRSTGALHWRDTCRSHALTVQAYTVLPGTASKGTLVVHRGGASASSTATPSVALLTGGLYDIVAFDARASATSDGRRNETDDVMDLDALRRAVHSDACGKISCTLWYSRLGLAYATAFPDKVGRFVLDAIPNDNGKVSLPSLEARF